MLVSFSSISHQVLRYKRYFVVCLVARGVHISANFNKWWLLPFGILTVSALTALNILVFGSSFIQQTASNPVAIDCSGPKANDFSCYQKRYEDLVYNSGVEAAFADLKDQFTKEQFVKASCHQLTHSIGRAAAELYGDDVLVRTAGATTSAGRATTTGPCRASWPISGPTRYWRKPTTSALPRANSKISP